MSVSREQLGGAAMHGGAHRRRLDGRAGRARGARRDRSTALSYLPDHHLADPPRHVVDDIRRPVVRTRGRGGAGTPGRLVRRARRRRRRARRRLLPRSARPLRAQPRHRARHARRPPGRHRREPAVPPRRARSTSRRRARPPGSSRGATPSTCRSSRSSTRPGFEPGRDLEWRGMIRHGAELVHAYAAATVPRICVVLRKAYGGAYIVMDSRRIGNDFCVAWPGAEIAVMGAAGAVAILNKGRTDPELVESTGTAFENPYRAAERGLRRRRDRSAKTRGACSATRSRCSSTSATRSRLAAIRTPPYEPHQPEGRMLLADKRILVTGVLNDASIAFQRCPAGARRKARRWCSPRSAGR